MSDGRLLVPFFCVGEVPCCGCSYPCTAIAITPTAVSNAAAAAATTMAARVILPVHPFAISVLRYLCVGEGDLRRFFYA